MATEKRCDATHALITGVDAAAGPVILECPDYVIRVEIVAWPGVTSPPRRPNLRWEAVRRMIEAHTHEPVIEGNEDVDVISLKEKRGA